jgi:hypothetical protein
LEKARQTVEALLDGKPIIVRGVLWNSEDRVDGMVDLLIRSDVLIEICPSLVTGEAPEAFREPAPNLGRRPWHYRAVDIKFTTIIMTAVGEASSEHLGYNVQNWGYNEALGKLQGYTAPASYLMGRAWQQQDQHGSNCLERLARVGQDGTQGGRTLKDVFAEAAAWLRLLHKEGASWQALPQPSRPELRPNMKEEQDLHWHRAKEEIARASYDLTQLWDVGPDQRAIALTAGMTRWDDPRLSASLLGFKNGAQARIVDAILNTNRTTTGPAVFPTRILSNDGDWRVKRPLELFVRFETVRGANDDFSRIPERGGWSGVYLIGCGWLEDGCWKFERFVTRDLSDDGEAQLIDGWIGHLERLATRAGAPTSEIRLFHWGPFPEHLPLLNWYDLLSSLVLREPVTVRGALDFGLKTMAKAFFSHGLIQTDWRDSRVDGLNAMVAAFRSDEEARRSGMPMSETELIREVGGNNELGCRAMMEILAYLRRCH